MALLEIAETDRLPEPEYVWKSVMSVGVISGLGKNKSTEKKSSKCASIYFEAIYTMLAYALALANMAAKRVGSQPALASEATLNEAIEIYCRASGILAQVGITWATRWNGSSAKNRPPETSPAGLQCLSDFMLLQAQILASIKAEKRAMSPSTITKLQRGTVEQYQTVLGHLRLAKGDWSDIFLAYLREGTKLCEALMLKRYAAHCHAEDKNGMAVACMTRCYNIFVLDLKRVHTPVWGKIHAEYKDELRQLLDTYVRINNHVTYEKVPAEDEMVAALPTATGLVAKKPFTCPQAAEIPKPVVQENDVVSAEGSDKSGSASVSVSSESFTEDGKAKPKVSVRDAFKSLLKVDKSDR